MREYEEEQPNFMLAFVCGILSALALVAIWAYITYFTNFQIGWMAVAVGYVISFVVRYFGKGRTQEFAVLGAALSLLTCFVGNMFYIVIFIANQETMPILGVLQKIEFSVLLDLYKGMFQITDLLFYGIALYEGYRLSVLPAEQEHLIGASA